MANAKVLLASSTKIGLELMRRCLKDLDLWILTAVDGPSVLQLSEKHHPQLIFMDMDLPGKSGVECCWQLRSSEYARNIPIVLITTGQTWDAVACLAAGCSDILSKPLDQTLFVSLGHKLLGSIELRESRVSCRPIVHCRISAGNFYGTIEDIGPHGMFIGTSEELKIGELVHMRFFLPWPGAEHLCTESTVAWLNQGKDRQRTFLPEGFGVVFSNPPPALVDHIKSFIEHDCLLLNSPEIYRKQ